MVASNFYLKKEKGISCVPLTKHHPMLIKRFNNDDDVWEVNMVLQIFHYGMSDISIKNGMWWKIHRGAYPNLS